MKTLPKAPGCPSGVRAHLGQGVTFSLEAMVINSDFSGVG
jgi:hypothetical protein